jgi:serine/threonine-protein kinase
MKIAEDLQRAFDGGTMPVMSDRYELQEKIAEGGRAVIWSAHDRETGRQVAFKRLSSSIPPAEGQREVEILRAVRHPNIVSLLDAGTDGQGDFWVMELLQGGTLESMAPLALEGFESLARQSLAALAAVHRAGWLHRDVKPGNLMQTGTGDWKLIDFGLACRRDAEIENQMTGSVHYMAPEQFQNAVLDERADVYALGGTFYHALTGRPPFEGETTPQVITAHLYQRPKPLCELRPDVPARTAGLIHRMLARLPEERPATVAEIQACPGFEPHQGLPVDTSATTA